MSVDRDGARALVVEMLAEQEAEGGPACVVLDAQTLARSWGWVFFYEAASFVRTGDPAEQLGGNAPIAVRCDGTVTVLSTTDSLEASLFAYELVGTMG